MNSKGQTLVMFIIFVPIFLLLFAFIVDTSFLIEEKIKLTHVTKDILKTTFDLKDQETIKALYEKNEIPIKNLKITFLDAEVHLANSYEISSIFGQIIGLKKYKVKVQMKAILKNDQLEIYKE